MAQDLTLNAAPTALADTPAKTTSTDVSPSVATDAYVDEPPRVFDTYARLYALSLVFLVPGVLSIANLPFRDYTFAYVSLVTVPFLLGLLATLFSDSRDPLKTQLIRAAVLTPIILVTGVTVLFTTSFIVLPISQVLTPSNFNVAAPIALISLLALAVPLAPSLLRSLRLPLGWRSVVHVLALLFAIAIVVGVAILTVRADRTLATMERKDVMIYIVGALTWYLPSFGIAAGLWRRIGLV
jgi:hypothetical protein